MKVLYFGAYDMQYSRNKINIEGLVANKIEVIQCTISKPYFRVDSKISLLRYYFLFPFSFIYRNVALIIKGYRLLKLKKIDIIIAGYPCHLDIPAAFILKKITGKPLLFDPLISIYDTFITDRKIIKNKLVSQALYYLEKVIYRMPDTVIMDTKAQANFLSRKFNINRNKVKTLYIGAESRLYKRFKLKAKKDFVVMFYGFASPLHGTEYIVNAAKLCQKIDKTIKFVLLGSGQTRERDIRLARNIKANNISFLPSMPEQDAIPIISQSDVMLGVFKGSPRSQRVIPNKVYQGIALAKPVVTESSIGVKELFTHKQNIYLCKPRNFKSLANAILKLKKNTKLRTALSVNAYRKYQSTLIPEKVGYYFKQILLDALNQQQINYVK